MRKLIFIFTFILIGMLLAACGGDDEDSGDEDNTSNETAATATPMPALDVPEPSVSSADLPAGTFTVLLTGQSDQTIEENARGRDESTPAEHVLMLFDPFSGYGATLYFPYGIQPGTYTMVPFQPAHAEGRVSATVTTRATGVYHAKGGILIIDSVEEGLFTGRFSFIAPDQSGARVYNAQGAFNQLALKQR
ncbi:MAG: hypothetical protein K8I82_31515 [Anaerolineae bacterium]|nr:hypothetical protein [Anaerolineae bacterium]